jgi:hypothetical protein
MPCLTAGRFFVGEYIMITKTLASCTAREFFICCNKLRKKLEKYYKDCDIAKIRKNMPDFTGNESKEERAEMLREQGRKNLSDILDVMLEKNVDDTLAIIGEMCFLTPEEVEKCTGAELMGAALDLISDTKVIDFFTKLVR